ncbi:hypothetical protein HDZ31DRAFT_66589 [Schizophyllum fasciatum]
MEAIYEYLAEDMFANGFHFCKHGHEYCNHCQIDLRAANDDSTLDPEDLDGLDEEELMKRLRMTMEEMRPTRKPLSIAGRVVKTAEKTELGAPIYACKEHKKTTCAQCFDWPRLIRAENSKKEKGMVNDRERVIGLLQSMGVDFPLESKLADDVLERRLTAALNFAQDLTSFAKVMPFKPDEHPLWKESQSKSVFDSVQRANLTEAMLNAKSMQEGRGRRRVSLYKNAFTDLRQTVMHLAKNHDKGLLACVLQDEDHTEAICIRILDVRVLDDRTPVMNLIYATGASNALIQDTIGFVQAQVNKGYVVRIKCTTQEQALLRKLLFVNSERVSPDFKPKLEPYEAKFKTSFILPVRPLSQVDIGKLTSDTGCAVCGKKTTSRCTGCLSIAYCGQECQKVHWKEHKSFCKTIRGGTWRTVTFGQHFEIGGKMMSAVSVNHSSGQPNRPWSDKNEPPPNVHGDKLFLVKVQRPLIPDSSPNAMMMVYDRSRTFEGYIIRRDNPGVYEEAMAQMPERTQKLKIYRWAKRVDGWKLSICLDREPEQVPQW